MRVNKYLKDIKNMHFSELECDCCGSPVYSTHPDSGSFCHFCEAFTTTLKGQSPNPDAVVIFKAQSLMRAGNHSAAADTLEQLSKPDDIQTLFGAGMVYWELSDAIYGAVNYTLPGFMEKNALQRNDEFDKNKYNAMHLLSKSKSLLFELLYNAKHEGTNVLPSVQYLVFAAQMKLHRRLDAEQSLKIMLSASKDSLTSHYSSMVYHVDTEGEKADTYINSVSSVNEINALFYLARNLIKKHNVPEARKVLESLVSMVYMPKALTLLGKIQDLEDKIRL